MRVRNSTTGTVVSVSDEAGQRYLSAGWVRADSSSASSNSSRDASDADGEDGTGAEDEKTTRRRRRRASE